MSAYFVCSGIGTSYTEINLRGLISLIKKSPKTRDKIVIELGKEGKRLDDIVELEELECYEMPCDIMVECINEIADTTSFVSAVDDECYVLFANKSPWEYSKREKELSKEDIEKYLYLLEDVVSEIEIETINVAVSLCD
jgi:hypothetical protein